MTSTRYGRIYLRRIDRQGLSSAVFEEVTTENVPGRGTESHTQLRVWTYDENKPFLGRPVYTLEDNCDEGGFVGDRYTPEFYQMTCGEDYRVMKLYRASDGVFMAAADYGPAFLDIASETRPGRVWLTISILDRKVVPTVQPPYPFALLTYMTRDAVLDRVIIAQDDLRYAELIASISDSSQSVAFVSVGGIAMLLESTSETALPSIRLAYSIWSDPSQQILIPITMNSLEIDKAALPHGFTLSRVPSTGDLPPGLVTPTMRNHN